MPKQLHCDCICSTTHQSIPTWSFLLVALLSVSLQGSASAQGGATQQPVGGISTFSNTGGGASSGLHTRPQAGAAGSLSSVPDDFSTVTLAPGYLLDMQVYDMPEISGELRVGGDGNITVPMAGPLHVEGLTLTQTQDAIVAKLKDAQILKNPKINLDIAQYAVTNVTVLGEVQAPGRVQLLAPHSLPDVLAMVGGETITAGSSVEIRRYVDGHMQTQTVNYARSKNTAAAQDIVVRPGDTVTVPRAGIVYVLGAVTRPGGYVLQEDGQLNVAEALSPGAGNGDECGDRRYPDRAQER